MWNGTADILNAKPTKINTIPKVKPYLTSFVFFNISKKFVDSAKPYIKEQPYKSNPDERALNTKYFKPDSVDKMLSLLNDANTYRANDWSSKPI